MKHLESFTSILVLIFNFPFLFLSNICPVCTMLVGNIHFRPKKSRFFVIFCPKFSFLLFMSCKALNIHPPLNWIEKIITGYLHVNNKLCIIHVFVVVSVLAYGLHANSNNIRIVNYFTLSILAC